VGQRGKRSLLVACAIAVFLALTGTASARQGLKPSAELQAQPAGDVLPTPEKGKKKAHPPHVPNDNALNQGKRLAVGHDKKAPSPGGSGSSPEPFTTDFSSTIFGGLNAPGFSATDNTPANNGTPPDPTGAIGPTHYLEFVNSKVGVYDRTNLSLLSSRDLDVFVGRSGQDVFDPQIQWDQTGNRWLYVADDVLSSSQNFLAFGWSKTADPSDLVNGWCRFVVGTGTTLEDYPKLGHDNNHILFGSNAFGPSSFLTAHVWSVAKPANGDTSCTAPTLSVFGSAASPLTTSDGTLVFTPVPANTADSLAAGYVVAADSPLVVGSPSQIMAWHVAGTPASPSLVPDGNMNVSAYSIPANVPQPGTSFVLDSSDARLTQAVAHADQDAGNAEAVWTQHTVPGPGGRSVARWYELLPAALTVRQQGTIQDASHFVFNAAISPAMNGSSAVIEYNIGSSTLLAQIRAQSRGPGTPVGTMGSEILLGTSAAADQDFSCKPSGGGPPCRWGDYAGATPDPLNDRVVWGTNQVNGPFTSDPHWTTRNFAIQEGTNGYPRPKSASPMRISLVPAFNACTASNRTHGPPLAFASCNPPVQSSGFLTVGTPDSNGAVANATGFVRLTAIAGDPSTPADEANVAISATTTDVRRKSDLLDYSGELLASVGLRLTDHSNGTSQTEPGTVTDFAYTFTVPCATTADPAIGSACSVNTTADALAPGTVVEGSRGVWQLDQAHLFDGGSDGLASTAGNTLFEVEGVFVP
jgi:hypothetical protein